VKKIAASLTFDKTKVDVCYSGPTLNILLKRWFPLFEVSSPTTITLEEPILPIDSKQQVVQE
jgi:hypothetical protein